MGYTRIRVWLCMLPLTVIAGVTAASAQLSCPMTINEDHFVCYKSSAAKAPSQTLSKPLKAGAVLADQFETKTYDASKIDTVCAPATKTHNANVYSVVHPDVHLVGYKIGLSKTIPQSEDPYETTSHEIADQFGCLSLNAKKPANLLVRSRKADLGTTVKCSAPDNTLCTPTSRVCDASGVCLPSPLPTPAPVPTNADGVNNYKCYKVKDNKNPALADDIQVTLQDQFGTSIYDVKGVSKICNPVDVDSGGVVNQYNHLVCYKIKLAKEPPQPKFAAHKVRVDNGDVGSAFVDVKKPVELCVPAYKDSPPPPPPTPTLGPGEFRLLAGGGTTGNCRGTCSGGTNNGNPCAVTLDCPGGGSCTNKACVGGPLDGTVCASASNCNGCSLSPPQGTCATVQSAAFPIIVPLNGVCVPRSAPDVSCVTDAECPIGKSCQQGKLKLAIGAPDGNQESAVTIPAGDVILNPTTAGSFGYVCVYVVSDGSGVVDCDGGRTGVDSTVSKDHNTTPGSPTNSGTANGLTDDVGCDDTFVQPDASISRACQEGTKKCVAGANDGLTCSLPADCPGGTCELCNAASTHPGVCNSPTQTVLSGTFGASDMQVTLPLSLVVLGTNPAALGADQLPCTPDDVLSSTPSVLPIVLSTGTNTAQIFDANNILNARIAPGAMCPAVPCRTEVTGAAASCANLAVDNMSGLILGGGFVALDQTPGDIATTFQFVAE